MISHNLLVLHWDTFPMISLNYLSLRPKIICRSPWFPLMYWSIWKGLDMCSKTVGICSENGMFLPCCSHFVSRFFEIDDFYFVFEQNVAVQYRRMNIKGLLLYWFTTRKLKMVKKLRFKYLANSEKHEQEGF